MNYNMFDRPYYDQMLDMDKSSACIPSGIIDQYRFIKFCGIVMEQLYCDVLTGEPTFKAI